MGQPLTQDQLFKQQQAIGKATSIASGAAALGGQVMGMLGEGKNINTTAPTPMMDSFGKPIFNLGNFTSQVSAIKPQGAQAGELLSAGLQGASSGAAFGPWGAAIGGATGLLTAALGGKRRKTLQQRRKTLAEQNLASAQRLYNQGIEKYNSKQSAQSLYNEQMMNTDNRINNVYQALS